MLVLTLDYGHLPWISLTLAFSFGTYGLVKKQADVDGTQSLAVETTLLFLPAAGYLVWLGATGDGTFTSEGAGPRRAARDLRRAHRDPADPVRRRDGPDPARDRGLLQYITPSMHFMIGVLVYGEPMPLSRLAGFALVWVALVMLAVDATRAVSDRYANARPRLTSPS